MINTLTTSFAPILFILHYNLCKTSQFMMPNNKTFIDDTSFCFSTSELSLNYLCQTIIINK